MEYRPAAAVLFKQFKPAFLLVLLTAVYAFPGPCSALGPDEVLVIANKNVSDSVALAKEYMQTRNIPETSLLLLAVTDRETCSRQEYDQNIAAEVRQHLAEKDPAKQIRCLVTVYGLPLKIKASEITPFDRDRVKKLKQRQTAIKKQLEEASKLKDGEVKTLKAELKEIQMRISTISVNNQRSSVDSELALVRVGKYSLAGWIPNPYFVGFKDEKLDIGRSKVLLVSRLDGPSREVVSRIIRDSIRTEKAGLDGVAYFDARWPRPDEQHLEGYAFYDNSIHRAADWIRKNKVMSVRLDDNAELFQPGDAPDAALYCGWYSLGKYVDAFTWNPGAVGYHIASSECTTLRNKKRTVWCKMMLEKGVAATIGPVYEPYVEAFSVPEIFFRLLSDGYFSLAECYFFSTPFLSWQMVLVGDPLYRPFKNVD